jgi:hypothetical protein
MPLRNLLKIQSYYMWHTRKSTTWSELPEKQLWLSLAYYRLVLPHESLWQPLEAPEPTRGQGSQQRWKPVTPAMAAGITGHIWTTQELLPYQVPVSFVERIHELEHLFQPIEYAHQGSSGQLPLVRSQLT